MVSALPEWDEIARFHGAVPRYTSYPTVPNWGALGSGQIIAALERVPDPEVAFYVHLPFCARLCSYCGCHSLVTHNPQRVRDYVALVLEELDRVAAKLDPRPLRQLHLGGGTPTYLEPVLLDELLSALLVRYRPASNAELAVEVDPSAVSEEHLRVLRGHGFNRLSIGVQDLDERVQHLIGRYQVSARAVDVLWMARQLGFASVNFDLMYGLPGQTPESIGKTVEWAAELDLDRFSVFGYAHVPSMKPQQRQLEKYGLPDPPARWEMLRVAHDTFLERGYVPVGIDHFAKPDDELVRAQAEGTLWRNFQGYTVLGPVPLVGLGISAISDVAGLYAQNTKGISEYRRALSLGELPTERGYQRSFEDDVRRFVITQLMCNMHLDFALIKRVFGITLHQEFGEELLRLYALADDGLCEIRDDSITLTNIGRPFARLVAAAFDTSLHGPVNSQVRYSAVV